MIFEFQEQLLNWFEMLSGIDLKIGHNQYRSMSIQKLLSLKSIRLWNQNKLSMLLILLSMLLLSMLLLK